MTTNYQHNINATPLQVRDILLMCDENFSKDRWANGKLDDYASKLSEHACIDVVKANSNTVGCNIYYINKETRIAYISIIAVNDKFRGKQIASLLLRNMYEKVSILGIKVIMLEVRKDNAPAQSLYYKNGFIDEEDRIHHILMKKIL